LLSQQLKDSARKINPAISMREVPAAPRERSAHRRRHSALGYSLAMRPAAFLRFPQASSHDPR